MKYAKDQYFDLTKPQFLKNILKMTLFYGVKIYIIFYKTE